MCAAAPRTSPFANGPMLWSRIDEVFDARSLQPRLQTKNIETDGYAAAVRSAAHYEPGRRCLEWQAEQRRKRAYANKAAAESKGRAITPNNMLWSRVDEVFDARPLQPRLQTKHIETGGYDAAVALAAHYAPGQRCLEWQAEQRRAAAWADKAGVEKDSRLISTNAMLWSRVDDEYDARPLQPRLRTKHVKTGGRAAAVALAAHYKPGQRCLEWQQAQRRAAARGFNSGGGGGGGASNDVREGAVRKVYGSKLHGSVLDDLAKREADKFSRKAERDAQKEREAGVHAAKRAAGARAERAAAPQRGY